MKNLGLTSLFLLLAALAFTQPSNLLTYNQQRLQKQKTAMIILGSWAVGNMVLGASLQGSKEGEAKYFHQMNIGWNAVNLVIAGFGYFSVAKADPGSFDFYQTMEAQHKIQKILLFNAGLDIGYMLGGAWLIERSKNVAPDKNPARLKGFGQSIVLQGAFLFAFDLITYFVIASDNLGLKDLLSNVHFNGNGIGLVWRF